MSRIDMDEHFFGLRENPFDVNPDPRYLVLTPQIRDALDALTSGVQTHKGLILLTGEVGTGKTTLINHLLDWLHQQKIATAFIYNSRLEKRHLFDFILAGFGVPFGLRTNGNALMDLNLWLVERHQAGDNPVLIVDEAQGLSIDLLEEIRLLLNLETPREKLLQIVLVGQPELEEMLKRRELRQLRQRIALRCKTVPLTFEETRAYIQARLRFAGSDGKPVFALEAVNALYFYSQGVPRVINLLCEQSLIHAYVGNLHPVPAAIVEEVAHEFQLDDGKRPVRSADYEDEAGAQSISMKSISAKVSTPTSSVTESTRGTQSARGIRSASVPFVIQNQTTLTNAQSNTSSLDCERAAEPIALNEALRSETERFVGTTEFTSEDAFRLLSELAIKTRSIASAPPIPRDESLDHFDLPTASQCSSGSRPEAFAPPAVTSNATTHILQRFSEKQLRKPRVRPIRWIAWWRTHWSSIAASHGRTPIISSLLLRLKLLMNPAHSTHWKWPAWRDRYLSILGSMALPGMIASLIRWLREPWTQRSGHLPRAQYSLAPLGLCARRKSVPD
jgi:general secretion pathway protein A